jgi:hypothetical protein
MDCAATLQNMVHTGVGKLDADADADVDVDGDGNLDKQLVIGVRNCWGQVALELPQPGYWFCCCY